MLLRSGEARALGDSLDQKPWYHGVSGTLRTVLTTTLHYM